MKLLDQANTQVTNAVAGAGITMPLWMQHLQDVSAVAAALVPIAAVVWLVVQIVGYVVYKIKSDE